MIKSWKKTKEGEYSFSLDNNDMGTMKISYNSLEREAKCQIQGKHFSIRRTGFWKSTIEIYNESGESIAKIYPEKWYASSWTFDYQDKVYKIKVRNNPLAEYVIQDNSKDLAAYGLTTENEKVSVRISTLSQNSDLLFDFILWYLFVPIATENMGDDFLFLMLLST